jgi:hypothetical protein
MPSSTPFFNWYSGVQLGPLGTAATHRPIVPAPGDYDGVIGRGHRSTRRKPAPVPLCPPQTPHANLGRRGGNSSTLNNHRRANLKYQRSFLDGPTSLQVYGAFMSSR